MSQISWLDPETLSFPPTKKALTSPNGLLAAGGDLRPARLISAYARGIFPWYSDNQPILWWSPNPRMVLIPSEIYINRSLKKRIRKKTYKVTVDTQFEQVIRLCAKTPRKEEDGTWITREMQDAYCELHSMGVAHSAEAWNEDGKLVGGLYGVSLGKVFFGESMFSLEADASKVAFATLVRQLEKWKYSMIDCQVETDHLASFGAKEIDRSQFESTIHQSIQPDDFSNFLHWKENWTMPEHGPVL
ncbi:leucyl/phenylalanyl-tRNA--protein transferase [Teredinibacter sp. KSP-S5-2]|uniref:leucyl/phenylalanyl-tRNA--protein transferase n=1 Tax=Teredinibacter sp. KSP-S5-2 TaxID=3034506 RepID=UPI00293496CD|nr:leucyl/phenylalanyl-tRNA--protein transferase [Teredinibacter sp. KSP-S5-2]WNO07548.1 leucyl/phenylalanyl-tRNA--protein transferase [Teredinibacter sp. KSP-S5-2]